MTTFTTREATGLERPADFDPTLDLWLERRARVDRARIWRCWTEPELLVKWWTPPPWTTSAAAIDPRPGGRFDTTMVGPDGDAHPNRGCFLEVVEGRRLTFTDVLSAGFRPTGGGMPFCATVRFEDDGQGGTLYAAHARHATPESREAHDAMGFQDGWGAVFEQAAALASTL